jgi:predicted transcriptional regulator
MNDPIDEPPMRTEDLNYPDTLRPTLSDTASMFDEALAAADAIDRGEGTDPEATRAFRDIADLRELLTDRRLAVLRAIYDSPPDSISALADRLDRAYSVVHHDVEVLAEHDIVQFRDGPRGAKRPYVPYDTIRVDIPLVGSPVTAPSVGIESSEEPGGEEDSGGSNRDQERARWFEDAVDPREESHL